MGAGSCSQHSSSEFGCSTVWTGRQAPAKRLCKQFCAGKSLLAGFLEVLFRRLLLEDLGNDTVELAADALLPLILAHPDAYKSLGRPLSIVSQKGAWDTSHQLCQSCQVRTDSSGKMQRSEWPSLIV